MDGKQNITIWMDKKAVKFFDVWAEAEVRSRNFVMAYLLEKISEANTEEVEDLVEIIGAEQLK